MDAAGFRVYFGDADDRVEWPGSVKFSAAVAVTAPGAPAADSNGESNILTIKRLADAASPGFWDWERAADGRFARKTLSIDVRDDEGNVARWNFVNAWPKKYTAATLKADGNEVAIESLELVHEGLSIR